MGPRIVDLEEIASGATIELGTGPWELFSQDRIDTFAEATGDRQWIHVDRRRAAAETEIGQTIAHGMLTLSWASAQLQALLEIRGAARRINYGVDRTRFLAPVPTGGFVRAKAHVHGGKARGDRVLYRIATEVEVKGADRPALIAELIGLAVPDRGS